MIVLLLLMGLLFPSSAVGSDTGLICAIDMGSNSFKVMVGEMKAGGYVQHQFIKNHLGVGDDMSKTGVISPPKLKEIRQTLKKYLTVCESKGIQTRAAVASARFSDAKNLGEALEMT